jgi:hypothetical protein
MIGEIVVCIDDLVPYYKEKMHSITIGNKYKIYSISRNGLLYVKDDKGGISTYNPNRFISLREYRKTKINNLLNNIL